MFKEATRGERPDITPAQIIATLVAGVPIIANLGYAFGVFAISVAQQDALTQAMTWGGILAGLLVGGDAGLRAARNAKDAKVDAAAVSQVPAAETPDGSEIPDAPGNPAVPDREITEDDLAALENEPLPDTASSVVIPDDSIPLDG